MSVSFGQRGNVNDGQKKRKKRKEKKNWQQTDRRGTTASPVQKKRAPTTLPLRAAGGRANDDGDGDVDDGPEEEVSCSADRSCRPGPRPQAGPVLTRPNDR